MALHRSGDKPLSEPTLDALAGVYMSLGLNELITCLDYILKKNWWFILIQDHSIMNIYKIAVYFAGDQLNAV